MQKRHADATVAVLMELRFKRDDLEVIAYNEFGGIATDVTITAGPAAVDAADGKNFTITLAVPSCRRDKSSRISCET